MTTCVVQVDQPVQIGQSLRVTVTDIDPAGVRLLVDGRIIGGPNDGEPVHAAYELGVGKSINVSPNIAIALAEIDNADAVLKVFAPSAIGVSRIGND